MTAVEHAFTGRLIMIGFGCIGDGILPLLLRHIDMQPSQVLVLAASESSVAMARRCNVSAQTATLTADNLEATLTPLLRAGDFVLNLSVDVSSLALIPLCRAVGALYLDTCIEPWAGAYVDPSLPAAQRTNYALREAALALRRPDNSGPTAVITHGANPGLISHFVKQALLDLARDTQLPLPRPPAARADWAQLAQRLGVRAIHVAERDSQTAKTRKAPNEFVNTWSVDGFVSEGRQPAELGWGSHELTFPQDGRRHAAGSLASIYLLRPGAGTRVRTWTPSFGPLHGFLITHSESISIADYLTLGDPARPEYRPTVHYAYHPCDDAVLSLHELAARNWRLQGRKRILKQDIAGGVDELGILLMGHARGAYWYGSRLSIDQARALAPDNSATSAGCGIVVDVAIA